MKIHPSITQICTWLGVLACQPTSTLQETSTVKNLTLQQEQIADSLELLWAHDPADVTGDGIADLVFISNNGRGGYLAYLRGQKEPGLWQEVMVAQTPPEGETFALGDLECADVDFDGDLDIIAAEHLGEWDSSAYPSKLYWFENPTWEPHLIGTVPEFIKDMSLVDFNKDQKMDIALLTFETSTLTIFYQGDSAWEKVAQYEQYGNLHEGMDVGDVNGDGWTDLVADAHIFFNPGDSPNPAWVTENLDEKWNNQDGDWSRNGTKIFLRDLDGDERSEIFVSHSERPGYPLSWYNQSTDGEWQEHVIADSIPACHTLQVFDFDGDGKFDVLAGINKSRAEGLGYSDFAVTVFLGQDDYQSWQPQLIDSTGIYNGQASDFDGDGDMDIFRYQTHDAKQYHLWINQSN